MRVSANAIGQRALDLLGRVKRTQNGDRFNGRQGECRRHIGRNASEANHFDVQLFTSRFDRLQICAREMAETQLQRMPYDRFLDFLRMSRKPITDRGPNEVGAVGFWATANTAIDMAGM